MSNGVGLAPLKTREYVSLLKDWGFTETDHGGNHPMFLTPDGKRFPMSTPGKVTMSELRKAAKAVGVTRRQFLVGPPKKPGNRMRTVELQAKVAEIKEIYSSVPLDLRLEAQQQAANGIQVGLDQLVAKATKRAQQKESSVARVVREGKVIDRIRQLFIDNPDKQFTASEIEARVGITKSQSGNPIMRLKQAGVIVSDGYGKPYRLAVAPEKVKEIKTTSEKRVRPEPVLPRPKVERAKRNGHLSFQILEVMEQNPDRPMSIDMVTAKVPNSPRSSVAAALLTLSQRNCIEQLARGIYRFNSPEKQEGFVSDETPPVSTHPDDEPIDLVPATPLPAEPVEAPRIVSSVLWEQVQDLGDSRFLLRDDGGTLWVAKMQRLDV